VDDTEDHKIISEIAGGCDSKQAGKLKTQFFSTARSASSLAPRMGKRWAAEIV